MLVIKHINGMFDCFSGSGYGMHTRIQLLKAVHGSIICRFVAGQRLPNNVVKNLITSLNPNSHYQTL